ncbi:hypothetical protein QTP86_011209 [Hemibagrus guttatus]|nr:hypothetical protein QTP86_011209 [Hemibagrus guttatus]
MKLRRGKASPKKEAADFTATGKDKDGFDVKYISSDKGRGVFSCVHFNKGDFLVEYRGQLINKLECDHRQKVYHDALKVFMFEFRFNGKLLWSINPGEEITYNYGDSEWPWRSKTASEKHQLQPQEMSTTSNEAVSEADPFTPTTAVTLEAIKQREQNGAGTVPEVTTSPTVVKDKSETVVPTEDTEKNEAGTVPEVTTSPTVVKDKSETVVPIEDTEKIAVVKEQSGSEGQETIGPSEKTAKNCEHKIVPATVSSMNKCAACVGPVVSLRWIGLRCKVCSCFWHKSCFSKIGKNESELLSWGVSSDEESQSDEEYVPESENESESSVELQVQHTEKQKAIDSRITKLNPEGASKGKVCFKAREGSCEEAGSFYGEKLTDVESDDEIIRQCKVKQVSKTHRTSVVTELGSGLDCLALPTAVTGKPKNQQLLESLLAKGKDKVTGPDEGVQVSAISCSETKKNYCYICGKPQSKISRHLKTHMAEVEVAKALSFPKNSKERKVLLEKLRNKGNYQHNTDVEKKGTGMLKNNELDQVADFLGHDIRVHREYYRLPEATIQLAKISKLLLAMEKGRLPDLQGKSLDDIEIEDEINTDGSAGSESENGGEGENLEACTSTPLQIGMRKDQTPNEDEAGVVQGNVAADAGNSRKRTRTPWSKREEVAVMKYFKSHIAKGKLATMVECLQCKTAEDPVLAGRTAQNIRDFVRNRGITLKRKAQCD